MDFFLPKIVFFVQFCPSMDQQVKNKTGNMSDVDIFFKDAQDEASLRGCAENKKLIVSHLGQLLSVNASKLLSVIEGEDRSGPLQISEFLSRENPQWKFSEITNYQWTAEFTLIPDTHTHTPRRPVRSRSPK